MECTGGKVRLVVYYKDVENVCRKETLSRLRSFMTLNEGMLFNGRLQLQKKQTDIVVVVKAKIEGVIEKNIFLNALDSIGRGL